MRTVLNFIDLIQFHLICLKLAKFSGVESEKTVSKFRKKNENFCVVFTFSLKRAREIINLWIFFAVLVAVAVVVA